MPRQVDARPGHKPTPDELDRLQRHLLARAVAVIMSPNWGKSKARPAENQVTVSGGSNG